MAEGERGHLKPSLKRLSTSFRNPLLDHDLVRTGSFNNAKVKPRDLENLRHVSDCSADECMTALHVEPGTDALDVLDDYVSRPIEVQDSEGPRKFMKEITTMPDWVQEDLIRQGQNVFWKYTIPILIILTDYSLVGGFAASRVTDILSCTNYFSTPDGTYHRLLETFKFLLDITGGYEALTPRKGAGWASIVRVRMLHAQVRLRILAEVKRHANINYADELGIPINQEDLLGTLCQFSISVVNCLRKMGINLSASEVEAYLHLWRLVGYFIGIADEYGRECWKTESGSSAIFCSISNHLFDPYEGSVRMAQTLLQSMALKPPLFWPFGLHVAFTRFLLGDKLSDGLGLEPSSWYWRFITSCVLVFLRWIHCSTIFIQQRIRLARTYIPRLYEAYVKVGRRKFEDSHHQRVRCDFSMKYLPHLTTVSEDCQQ